MPYDGTLSSQPNKVIFIIAYFQSLRRLEAKSPKALASRSCETTASPKKHLIEINEGGGGEFSNEKCK